MECMMIYGGNNLMNMVVTKVYQAQRNSFKGSGNSNGIAYSFDVAHVPVANLVANVATHNLEIDLKVAITATGTFIAFDKTLAMKATGRVAISQNRLSLTGMAVTTTSTDLIDQLVVGIIDAQIIPKLSVALANIPIPQLTNIFGSSLSASLHTGTVISGPALEVGARITGKSGIAAADAPTVETITALNNGTAANALVVAMVSSSALNVLLKAVLPPLTSAFDERATGGGFGAGIKGTIKATTPVLTVTGGNGKITTTISFAGLKGGIDTPFTQWKWVALSAPTATVVIKHTLSAVGQVGVIKLTSVDQINVSLNWPSILKPVEALAEKLLDSILSLFHDKISQAVRGKKFDLFELPATIPGTSLAATLRFDTNGLGYFKSSVRALIRIQDE